MSARGCASACDCASAYEWPCCADQPVLFCGRPSVVCEPPACEPPAYDAPVYDASVCDAFKLLPLARKSAEAEGAPSRRRCSSSSAQPAWRLLICTPRSWPLVACSIGSACLAADSERGPSSSVWLAKVEPVARPAGDQPLIPASSA